MAPNQIMASGTEFNITLLLAAIGGHWGSFGAIWGLSGNYFRVILGS